MITQGRFAIFSCDTNGVIFGVLHTLCRKLLKLGSASSFTRRGSYINCLYAGLAEQLNLRVWLPIKQRKLITAAAEGGCMVCRSLLARTSTSGSSDAQIHVVDMARLNPRAVLNELLPTGKLIIAWKPSGWMYNPQKKVTEATLRRLPCSRDTFLRLRNCVSVEIITKTVYVLGESLG